MLTPKYLRPQRAPLRRGVFALAGLAALAVSAPAVGDSVESFAQRLTTLRGEVESLSAELSNLTADSRDELRSLARQKADLELELKKEQTRTAKLEAAAQEKRKSVEESKDKDAQLEPVFHENLALVRAYVKQGLPFRTDERLAALDKLEDQLKTGLLSAPKAVSRLWTFVEDEFRLTRESGMYQQQIRIDGQEELADVIRIGTVMLVFRTRDGQVGHAVKKGDQYAYVTTDDVEETKQIAHLFDSFRKQIRVGYFELPNLLAETAVVAQGGSQ